MGVVGLRRREGIVTGVLLALTWTVVGSVQNQRRENDGKHCIPRAALNPNMMTKARTRKQQQA